MYFQFLTCPPAGTTAQLFSFWYRTQNLEVGLIGQTRLSHENAYYCSFIFEDACKALWWEKEHAGSTSHLFKQSSEAGETSVWSSFHTYQIFIKYKPTLSHLLLPAHLAADLLALLKQPAEQTCKQELETQQHYQVWKRLVGKKKSHFLWCTFARITQYFSPSLNEVEQQVKKGRGSGTHHSQGDHRWNCPHSWVLLKCSADSFTAVPQKNFPYHETVSYRWQNPAQRPEKITKAKQTQQNKQIF